MRRARKILLGLAGLAAAVVVALVAILLSIDFSQYKSIATAEVEAATGRRFEIAGNIELALSLTPRLVAHDVTLANAEWGTRPDMLRVKQVEAEVALMPLFSGEIKVRRLVLDGVDLLLETAPSGDGNWIFGETETTEPAETAGQPRLPEINDVTISNAMLRYRDGSTGEEQTLAIADLRGLAADLDDPVKIAIDASVNESPIAVNGTLGSLSTLFADRPFSIDGVLKMAGGSATVKGDVTKPLTGQGLTLDVAIEGNSLSELAPILGSGLPGTAPYRLTGTVTDPDGAYQLDPFQLTVGSSALSGMASIGFGPERPKIIASVTASSIDLKDFGLDGASDTDTATPGDGRVFPADALPLAGLGIVDAAIELSAERLTKGPVTFEKLRTTLSLDAGKLVVANLESGIGGGSFMMSGIVDSTTAPAEIAAEIQARQVEVGELLRSLEISDVLGGGSGDLDLNVTGRGNSVREVMAGLDGNTNFAMKGGHIDNGFARLMLSDLFSLVSLGSGSSNTEINCFVARFDIKTGQAAAKGLVLDTSGATVFGSGGVNLATEGLALRVDPHAKATNLTNLAIPMQIGGTIASPSVIPDPTAIPGKVVGAASDTAVGVFNILGDASGLGTIGAGGNANPCATALDSATGSTPPPSAGGELLEDVGGAVEDTVKGVGDAIDKLFP